MLSITHIISIIITILGVSALGVYSIKSVKNASDFAVGGKNVGVPLLIGTLVGTIAGGASTVGTAQLAYTYGMSAWWFTLGAGIGLIILGAFFAKPLRESEVTTGPELLAKVYGKQASPLASIFSSIGIFLNIIGQILSSVALLTAIFNMDALVAAIISVLLVIFYVIFGGVMGTGMVGILKTALIYFSMIVVGFLAVSNAGGFSGYTANLEPFPNFSLFGRGIAVDLAAGFSLIVGVLSTQTYLQAMFSGTTYHESKKAAIISGLLIPPLGVGGILVGLYMKMNFPGITPKEALPLFILTYLPDWVGGIVLATLLISVVGTGAGLVLGVSTMLSRDIYKGIIKKDATDQQVLLFSRIAIILVTGLTLVFAAGNMNSLILQWSFLSMGLRGATICFPLIGALFFKEYIRPKAAIIAIGFAPFATILWAIFMKDLLDPLYVGMILSVLIITAGSFGYSSRKDIAKNK
jgi:SSS family solute:Na+ symporter